MAFSKKKSQRVWLWLAVDRDGKRIVAWQLGGRDAKTGRKLWQKIKGVTPDCYCTDYLHAYKNFVPANKHVQTKAETYCVELVNRLLRHYCARFRRKTYCISQSLDMINHTVNLFVHRDYIYNNKVLSMLI